MFLFLHILSKNLGPCFSTMTMWLWNNIQQYFNFYFSDEFCFSGVIDFYVLLYYVMDDYL